MQYLSATRKLDSERFDESTIHHFKIKMGESRGARHGKSKVQREYHQARLRSRKAHKSGFKTILQRLKGVKLIETRSSTSDGLKSFASTWTKLQKKTQQHKDPATDHAATERLVAWSVDPKTGQVWWPSSESWSSSSTTWWSSTGWDK